MLKKFTKINELPKNNSYVKEFVEKTQGIFSVSQQERENAPSQLANDWIRKLTIIGVTGREIDRPKPFPEDGKEKHTMMKNIILKNFPKIEADWLLQHYSQQPSYLFCASLSLSTYKYDLSVKPNIRTDKVYWNPIKKAIFYEQTLSKFRINEDDDQLIPGAVQSSFKLTGDGFIFDFLEIEGDLLNQLFAGRVPIELKGIEKKIVTRLEILEEKYLGKKYQFLKLEDAERAESDTGILLSDMEQLFSESNPRIIDDLMTRTTLVKCKATESISELGSVSKKFQNPIFFNKGENLKTEEESVATDQATINRTHGLNYN